MASAMEITDTGRTNVVSRGYLHSTTFNFRNTVAVGVETSRFYMGDQYYEDIEKRLIDIRNKLVAKEESFYRTFGINTGDNSQNAFLFNRLLGSSLERYSVLQKMNTNAFLNNLDNKLFEMVQAVADYFQDKITDPNIDIDKILRPKDLDSMLEESVKLLNKTFYLTFGKRSQVRQAVTKSGQVNKTYEVRFGEVYEKLPKEAKKISKTKSSDFLNNMISYLRPDAELEALIRKSFNKIKNRLNISTYERNNRVGIVGEIQAQVFIDLLLNEMADNAPKSFYVGDLYDSKTGKQSPIDFLIGRYGIQVKNTTESIGNSTIKPFYDIRVQTDVTLETFIRRLDTNPEEFRYFITNAVWLKNNGLNKDQEEDRLNFNDVPMILEYINNILSLNAEKLLHTEATKVINKQGKVLKNTYGNTFFLLKGRYLIPVSVMVDGLIKTLREEEQKNSSGIGYFRRDTLGVSNKKKGKEVKLTSAPNLENAIRIQNEKRAILANMNANNSLSSEGLDYSGELLDYGTSLGEDLANGMNIRVNYKFITENLNKIENNLRLW